MSSLQGWETVELGEVITLKRGYDLPASQRNPNGKIPVISSAGIFAYHDAAQAKHPGVVTGRYGRGQDKTICQKKWRNKTI